MRWWWPKRGRRPESPAYVYIVLAEGCGACKFGVSRDPAKRLAQLQTANFLRLRGVARKKCQQPYRVEADLHRQFGNFRIRGEWFALSDALISLAVERLREAESVPHGSAYEVFF